MSNIPADLKYTSSHEWVRLEGEIAVIGITEFAQSELGDVVFVDLPTVGRVLAEGDSFGNVESVKTVSELYAPVAGTVVEINETLGAQSELINTDPYGKGFLIKIQVSDVAAVDALLDAAGYSALIG